MSDPILGGPWVAVTQVNSLYIIRDNVGDHVCAVLPRHANVIAAAPEMKAVLAKAEALLADYMAASKGYSHEGEVNEALRSIHAVLDKAEGKPPKPKMLFV